MTCIAAYVASVVYSRVVFGPLASAAQNLPEEEIDDEEEARIFLPFPLTTKQLQPRPYRGSDPEWQEYIRFSKDQAQGKRVREQLANFVVDSIDKHPVMSLRCGKGMKLRRYWLDIDFPPAAPPEFVRSGIEITDEHIAWAQAPVDSLTVFRQRQILWPSAMAMATWSFAKVMVIDDVKRIAGMLGFSVSPPPSLDQMLAQHQQAIKNAHPNRNGPNPQLPGEPNKAVGNSDDHSEDEVANDATKAAMALKSHFVRPIMAFKARFLQTWKPVRGYPPAGSIIVSGFVEIDAPKAWLVFDIKAAWDPKTRNYDLDHTNIQLRRFQPKRQGPVGGA